MEVGGERIHLVERGRQGPRLLLLHGYASNAQAWRAVMDRLDGRFQMAAVDAVGFGWSTRFPMAPLTGDAYAERARRLLLAALRLRGALIRGDRGRMYREGASWLASGRVGDLLG